MDFMHDQLADGRTNRLFNVIDDYSREGMIIDANFSLPADRVIRSLEQLIDWRGMPKAIRCDNGPEYVSRKLIAWAKKQGIDITSSSLENPSRIPMWSATTERSAMTGKATICLNELRRCGLCYSPTVDLQQRTVEYGTRRHTPKQKIAMAT